MAAEQDSLPPLPGPGQALTLLLLERGVENLRGPRKEPSNRVAFVGLGSSHCLLTGADYSNMLMLVHAVVLGCTRVWHWPPSDLLVTSQFQGVEAH